uniref:acid phosphatase n=1 Tax=Hadrurus spadix TaxID=141984 RepID=A0A1W7RAZ5_9SCOR
MLLLYPFCLYVLVIFDTKGISSDKAADSDLKLLHIISRHGARNPDFFYPKDPHRNYNFIGGLSQLTNLGKLQQYTLGQFLKERYRNFLTSNPKEVYARSSNIDRTMESAMALLAGLYPPESDWIWNKDLKWQPIPVHSVPGKDDSLLNYRPDCPAVQREYKKLKRSEIMQAYNRDNQDFFQFLSEETGMDLNEWHGLIRINSILEIERQNNLSMPHWATNDVIERLRFNAALSLSFLYGNTALQRLRGGPLIAEMINNMQRKLNGSLENRKIFVYTTHDIILAAVMSALGIYNNQLPPFSATMITELHSHGNENFLRIFYLNSTTPENYQQEPHLLQIPGCPSDCPLEAFVNLTKRVVPVDWKKECL